MFSKIEKASVSLGGNYLHAPSKGLAYVEVVKSINGHHGLSFIAELMVLESSHADDKPGDRRSWVVNMKHDAALGNVKGFVMAAKAIAEEAVTEAVCEDAVGPKNPLMGKLVEYETYMISTKDDKAKDKAAGKPAGTTTSFTKHAWYAVDPELQAQAAAIYEEVGKPGKAA